MSGNSSTRPRPRDVSRAYTEEVLRRHRGRYCGCLCSRLPSSTDTYLREIRDWIYRRTDLDTASCELIVLRFGRIFKRIRLRMHRAGIFHSASTLFTGVASLVVTAFISINNTSLGATHSTLLWWGSWVLSLSISILAVFSSFYKFDRKFLLLFSSYVALDRELWMFLELVGSYAPNFETGATTHTDQVSLFLFRIERVQKRLNDSLLEIERQAEEGAPAPQVTSGASNSKEAAPGSEASLLPGLLRGNHSPRGSTATHASAAVAQPPPSETMHL